MSATIFAPNRQYKSKNLRGLLSYARRSIPVAVSLEVRRDPATGAPYFMRIDFADGAIGFAHWQDWRVAADWIAARRSWNGPAIASDNGHVEFASRLRAHYLKLDGRYTVRPEWCGHEVQKHVGRFCGDYVGAYDSAQEAWEALKVYDEERFA